MTTDPLHEAFGTLREFLHANQPDDETREELFSMLSEARRRDEPSYREVWLPYVTGFADWLDEPLRWVRLPWTWDTQGRRERSIAHEDYRAVMPEGPFKVRVMDLRYRYFGDAESLLLDDPSGRYYGSSDIAGDFARCTGVEVNAPILYDDSTSQEYWEIPAETNSMITTLASELEHAPNLRQLTFIMPETQRFYSFQDDHSRRAVDTRGKTHSWQQLADALADRPLRRLRLSNGLTQTSVRCFKDALWWPELRALDLSNNRLGVTTTRRVFDRPMPHLTRLSLRGNETFGDAGALAIAQSEHFPALEHLDLRGCGVTDETRLILTQSVHLPALAEVLT